jgi:hypothetical protein
MQRFKIITLVDITRSLSSRSETDPIKIGQQANFNSLIQTIGIRSNMEWIEDPVMYAGRLPDGIEGKANHWIWDFTVERDLVFKNEESEMGLLVEDLHNVPIIPNLKNSAELSPPAFQTKGKHQNTWITII